MPDRFDVTVIGGGSGGYVGAIRAAKLGLRVAVVEEDKVGGTCLHRGCIPTKALLQSAALLDQLRSAARLGIRVQGVDFDYGEASSRRDQVVGTLHRGVEYLLRKNGVTTIAGRGRLDGAGRVAVARSDGGTDGVEAQSVVIATGSRPRAIPGLVPDERRILTSDGALRLETVPRSAVVLGAGAVGVEFASLYRSLGSEVTLVEMESRLTPLEDADVGDELEKRFLARGIRCLTGSRLDPGSVELNEGGLAMTVHTGEGEQRLQAEVLLVAVGRTANVEDLGLEDTGVAVERGTIAVDGHGATGDAGVYAVGDVVGGFWLAHKAMHEGEITAEAIAGGSPQPLDPMQVPRTTYCTPQIGSLGMSEKEARAAGRTVSTGLFPFRGNARALIWGEPDGFCKVVADAQSGDVLGVHIVGHEVTELIAGPALGALLEATPFELSRAVAPHPTLSEALGEAALALSGQAIHI